jgi:Lon protease-like protein
MSITMQRDRDDIYRLDIRRLLLQAEVVRVEDALAAEITRIGAIKLLVVLHEFEGWERQGNWDHATFYAEHGDDIARIAIVGPERWRTEMLMFAAEGLRKGAVEFFPENAGSEALAWLAA